MWVVLLLWRGSFIISYIGETKPRSEVLTGSLSLRFSILRPSSNCHCFVFFLTEAPRSALPLFSKALMSTLFRSAVALLAAAAPLVSAQTLVIDESTIGPWLEPCRRPPPLPRGANFSVDHGRVDGSGFCLGALTDKSYRSEQHHRGTCSRSRARRRYHSRC